MYETERGSLCLYLTNSQIYVLTNREFAFNSGAGGGKIETGSVCSFASTPVVLLHGTRTRRREKLIRETRAAIIDDCCGCG